MKERVTLYSFRLDSSRTIFLVLLFNVDTFNCWVLAFDPVNLAAFDLDKLVTVKRERILFVWREIEMVFLEKSLVGEVWIFVEIKFKSVNNKFITLLLVVNANVF